MLLLQPPPWKLELVGDFVFGIRKERISEKNKASDEFRGPNAARRSRRRLQCVRASPWTSGFTSVQIRGLFAEIVTWESLSKSLNLH
jgi:hypothetical protein